MEKLRRLFSVIILIIIISTIIITLLQNRTYAVTQSISSDIDGINESEYPGYKELIKKLQSQYPNWKIRVCYTNLDWNEVIANEYTGHGSSPRNLVPASYSSDWTCSICGNKAYDNGTWKCASESAIKYMMDPRNFLNVENIFQFEELTDSGYEVNKVREMVVGTFLEGHADGIMQAANKNNVNPYYIVARLIQEQGRNGSVLVSGQGYGGQYVGYYNAFNIGAYGSTNDKVILNGLSYAQSKGWNTLEKSIDEGINFLANDYIRKGQNTLYLQKFDVDASDGQLYWHQYMQNLLAAQNEQKTLKTTYESINSLSSQHFFVIPLYKNMPVNPCSEPGKIDVIHPSQYEVVKVNVSESLRLRNEPNGSKTVGWLWKDEYVTRLEKAESKVGGTYWDKVMKSDGTMGYAARETYDTESEYKLYLVPVKENNNTDNPNESITPSTDKVKIDEANNTITVKPDVIAQDILDCFGRSVKIVKGNDQFLEGPQSDIGTGYKVEDKYTVIKNGDCNGDGKITAGDYVLIKNNIMEVSDLNELFKKGADYNEDEKITASDYVLVKNYIMNN